MFHFNHLAVEAQTKQAQMLHEAEQKRLSTIAQSDQPRFRFLSWRLPDFRRQPVTAQSKKGVQCEVNRKPASNQGW